MKIKKVKTVAKILDEVGLLDLVLTGKTDKSESEIFKSLVLNDKVDELAKALGIKDNDYTIESLIMEFKAFFTNLEQLMKKSPATTPTNQKRKKG